MANRLLKRGVEIDRFVSSPANRAFSTATYFAEAYEKKQKHIVPVDILYHAEVEVFYKVISELNDDDKTVALFSHNPGITYFVNSLTNSRIDNMPTCGIFAVKSAIKSWKDFRHSEKGFWFFDYPKLG
jgi:phosphohistidine phosphatase